MFEVACSRRDSNPSGRLSSGNKPTKGRNDWPDYTTGAILSSPERIRTAVAGSKGQNVNLYTTGLSTMNVAERIVIFIFSYFGYFRLIVPSRFELESLAPNANIIDYYNIGLSI